MNFKSWMEDYSIQTVQSGEHHHVTGEDWIGLDCPYCSLNTRRFRLGFNTRYGYFSCWQCGYRNLYETIKLLTGESFGQIKSKLEELNLRTERNSLDTPSGKLVLPEGIGPLLECHKRYLKTRGFEIQSLCTLWGIQGIGLAARLSWRIFIPFHYKGKIVSWTTRSISDNVKTRYITASASCESMRSKNLLYGEDHVRHTVLVHEGPLDVWATGMGSVATMGIVLTAKQILRLSKYPHRVICFDNEPKAQERAKHLCDQLSIYPGITQNVVLDSKDPASASPQEISKLRRMFK